MSAPTAALAVKRLRAYAAGHPVPRGETIRVHVADNADLLVVVFVRMGGESRPWGIAFGRPDEDPALLSIPEARNRDLVAAMCAEFAPALLEHLRVPGHVPSAPTEADDLWPVRQVWTANATHVDMLHHVAYAYTFTRAGGENRELLNGLGRACSWLFREAERPGGQTIVTATGALTESYVFPCEPIRQGHLGYLLAWLGTPGGFETRQAAAAGAELLPISTSLDPVLERQELAPLVEAWNEARRASQARAQARVARRIETVMRGELRRRFDLVVEAIDALRCDPRPVNGGIPHLLHTTAQHQWEGFLRTELALYRGEHPFVPPVETDRHPAAAAARFLERRADAEQMERLLVHYDRELLDEVIAAGEAFRGEIIGVENAGTTTTVPVWTVRVTAPPEAQLSAGDEFCVVGLPRRWVVIDDVEIDQGELIARVRITSLVLPCPGERPPHNLAPISHRWQGRAIAFLPRSADGISRLKARRVWNRDAPGAWLTLRRPGGHLATLPSRDTDTDDVPELERRGYE